MSAPPPPPESPRVPTRKALLVGVLTLALFTVAVGVQYLLMRAWEREPRATVPPEVGREELGMVNQEPFELDTRAARLWSAQRQHLQGYGWTDREAGLIHIPVDEAMRRLLEEEGAGGSR